jgi:hypothetical protein
MPDRALPDRKLAVTEEQNILDEARRRVFH